MLKVVKKRKKKEKEKEKKPKPKKAEVKYLETPYNTAMRELLEMKGGNLDAIEKELNQKPPQGIMFFFHLRYFKHVLQRVKLNTLSIEDLNRWLSLLRARIGDPVYPYDLHGILGPSYISLLELQDENKMTREAVIALLDRMPIEMELSFNLDDFRYMEAAGKKKKTAKVRSMRKKKK
ncbi:MAG: hypothetical protein ABI855_07945 [Bacteroidota bacterium]